MTENKKDTAHANGIGEESEVWGLTPLGRRLKELEKDQHEVAMWERKVECPKCKGQGWQPYIKEVRDEQLETGLAIGCSSCGGSGGEADLVKGTGTIVEYPMRVECSSPHRRENPNERGTISVSDTPCKDVGCDGWIPQTDPIVWMDKISSYLGTSIAWCRRDNGIEMKLTVSLSEGDWDSGWIWGVTLRETIFAAAAQWVRKGSHDA